MNKKIKISVLAMTFSAIICLASLLSLNLFAEATETERTVIDSGKSGDVTWTLYDDGELCVEGNGKMASYGFRTSPLGDYADSITSVNIKNGITYIGAYSFYGCSLIESIEFPDSVTGIGSDAFLSCTNLSRIKLPNGITGIGNDAFTDTAYYSDPANWDNGMLYLGNCLIDAKEGTSFKLYSKTTLIAQNVFTGFKRLTNVYIPNGVQYINSYAFSGCTSLKEVEIPSSVQTISKNTFAGCSSLEKVTLHDGLTTIQVSAFLETTSLKEIYIPKTVTSIAYSPFGLSGVTDIYFGGSKADWKRATKNNSLGSITVHYTLESDDKSVMIVHTDADFDYEAGNVHLVVTELGKATSSYEQNGFYGRLMANPIQVLDIKLVDGDENTIQPLEEHKITVKIKASDEFMNLMKSGLSAVSDYVVQAGKINFQNDSFVFKDNGNTVAVPADEDFLNKFKIIHWYSDAVKPTDHDSFTHDEISVENGYIILETDHFSEYAVCTELIKFKNNEATLEVGQATKLNVNASENTKLSFKSSDNKVVTVDTSGNVTAVGSGTATVTVTIDGTTISDACTVTVPARKFTVKWIVDGVETSETVYENAAIVKPKTPKKDGYTFVDWSPAVPEKMPAYSMTFTAVYEKAAVTSIEIISAPDKTNYTYKTDKLDLSGIVIRAVYSNGTNEIISDVNRINAHGFTLNFIGSKDIVIEYGGCTAKLRITVSYSWWQQIIRFLLLGFIWY